MAIWQCSLELLPRQAVLKVNGTIPESARFRLAMEEGTNFDDTNYWADHDTGQIRDNVGRLLPEMRSWSDEALMFGGDEGDRIQLWSDSISMRVDCRDLDFVF